MNFVTLLAEKKVIILEGGIVPRILEKEKFPKMSRSVAAALQTSKDFTKLTLKHFSVRNTDVIEATGM